LKVAVIRAINEAKAKLAAEQVASKIAELELAKAELPAGTTPPNNNVDDMD
jgi:hypothetical protein